MTEDVFTKKRPNNLYIKVNTTSGKKVALEEKVIPRLLPPTATELKIARYVKTGSNTPPTNKENSIPNKTNSDKKNE